MTNTPNTQDDTTQQPGAGQGDALAQLEALLQKTRANKGAGGGAAGMPSGGQGQPSLEEMQAQAEAVARAEAEKEALFAAQQARSELERQEALAAQQQKMQELAKTPQYIARVEQTMHEQEQKQEEQAAHDGHQILQITTKKL
jgi:hypothetical protein